MCIRDSLRSSPPYPVYPENKNRLPCTGCQLGGLNQPGSVVLHPGRDVGEPVRDGEPIVRCELLYEFGLSLNGVFLPALVLRLASIENRWFEYVSPPCRNTETVV